MKKRNVREKKKKKMPRRKVERRNPIFYKGIKLQGVEKKAKEEGRGEGNQGKEL